VASRNRRLVPMPTARARHKPLFSVAHNTPELLPPPPTVPPLQVPRPATRPGRSTLKEDAPYIWAFIALCAFWYYAQPWFYFALFIAAVVLLLRGGLWLSRRFPMTMYFVNCFIAALLGGGRRRRW
jgi:hypothetical protein